jgi:hypothetical protein
MKRVPLSTPTIPFFTDSKAPLLSSITCSFLFLCLLCFKKAKSIHLECLGQQRLLGLRMRSTSCFHQYLSKSLWIYVVRRKSCAKINMKINFFGLNLIDGRKSVLCSTASGKSLKSGTDQFAIRLGLENGRCKPKYFIHYFIQTSVEVCRIRFILGHAVAR